jgi:hypothetical protein
MTLPTYVFDHFRKRQKCQKWPKDIFEGLNIVLASETKFYESQSQKITLKS